jgi:glucose-6-phosphate isomerase
MSTTLALKNLKAHRKSSVPDMRKLFSKDSKRFSTFSASQEDLLLDYSKCAVTAKTISLLQGLAKSAKVEAARDAMMRGDIINTTEHRAVLHTALRRPHT